jgi:hypothetical protein
MKIKTVVFIIFIVFIVGLFVYIFMENKKEQETMKLIMQDERLKNAKQFYIENPVAISHNGFIGIVNSNKMTIVPIKDIKEFQIEFNRGFKLKKEILKNETDVLLFNNIISKVESYLNNTIKDIYLLLNMEDGALLTIILLSENTDNDGKVDFISKRKQKEIKEFLSELENVEKNIKTPENGVNK